MRSRLPDHVHHDQPWQIHAVAPEFELEDVWRVRTPGAGPEDFDATVSVLLGGREDSARGALLSRALVSARRGLGRAFGWDAPEHGLDTWSPAVAGRLAPQERAEWDRAQIAPFSRVFSRVDEEAHEMANATVHALMHLGWVRGPRGDYELHVAALVKPHGQLGRTYMRAIEPFRLLVVWPALIRAWERAWAEREHVGGGCSPVSGLPRESRARLSLAPDYADVYTITTDVRASPREWMTACFEAGIPRSDRDLVFRRLLRLSVEPDGTPGTIAGWSVTSEDDDHLCMRVLGRGLEVNLLMERAADGVRLTTALRHRSRAGQVSWQQLSRVHRSKIPGVLRRGSVLLRRHSPTLAPD